MRWHWEPTDTWSCAASTFRVDNYHYDQIADRTNTIDIWVRALARSGEGYLPHVYVTATKSQAEAITGALATNALRLAAGVIEYWDGIAPFASTTIIPTQVTGATPVLTGLALGCAGTDPQTASWDYLCGYVASPGAYVLSEIRRLLRARNGAGQLLSGYTDAAIERSFGEFNILSAANQIVGAHVQTEPVESATNLFGLKVHFTVIIGRMKLEAPQNVEDMLIIAGGIHSLLQDEKRTLDGLCVDTQINQIEGPTPAAGAEDHVYQTVRVGGICHFNPLRSDK